MRWVSWQGSFETADGRRSVGRDTTVGTPPISVHAPHPSIGVTRANGKQPPGYGSMFVGCRPRRDPDITRYLPFETAAIGDTCPEGTPRTGVVMDGRPASRQPSRPGRGATQFTATTTRRRGSSHTWIGWKAASSSFIVVGILSAFAGRSHHSIGIGHRERLNRHAISR